MELKEMIDELAYSTSADRRFEIAKELGKFETYKGNRDAILALVNCISGVSDYDWDDIVQCNDKDIVEKEIQDLLASKLYEDDNDVHSQCIQSLSNISTPEFNFHMAKILCFFISKDRDVSAISHFLLKHNVADGFVFSTFKEYINKINRVSIDDAIRAVDKLGSNTETTAELAVSALKEYFLKAFYANEKQNNANMTSAIDAIAKLTSANISIGIKTCRDLLTQIRDIEEDEINGKLIEIKNDSSLFRGYYYLGGNKYEEINATKWSSIETWFVTCLNGIISNIDSSHYPELINELKTYLVPKQKRTTYYHKSPYIKEGTYQVI